MRKQHSSTLKAEVVLEALRETKTLAQIATEYEVHPSLVTKWKAEATGNLTALFERGSSRDEKSEASERKTAELYQEIGRLTTQLNWIKKNLASNLNRTERLEMLDQRAMMELPLSWQAEILSVSRSSLYYQERVPQSREVTIKHLGKNSVLPVLDELYTEHPFLGSRKIAYLLEQEGTSVSRHTIRRYRVEMGLETLYPKPRTSQPGNTPEHTVYPYLLRGLTIERSNQVWGQA